MCIFRRLVSFLLVYTLIIGLCPVRVLAVDEEECSHASEDLDGYVEPDCVSDGYTGDWVCSDCGEILEYGDSDPAFGHTETDYGNGGVICDLCGEILIEEGYPSDDEGEYPPEEEEPCTHFNQEWMYAYDGNCIDDGYTGDLVCVDCGEILEEGETITAPGQHSEVVEPAVEPGFLEPGKTEELYCSECGEVLQEAEEIPAKIEFEYLYGGSPLFSDFEELKFLAENYHENNYYAFYDGDGSLTITEDLIVPQGFSIYFLYGTVIVPEGVTLTANRHLQMRELIVDGTVIDRNGMEVTDKLTVNGELVIDHSGTFFLGGDAELNGLENIVLNDQKIMRNFYITEEKDLQAAVHAADHATDSRFTYSATVDAKPYDWYTCLTGAKTIVNLQNSLTIPENLSLWIADTCGLSVREQCRLTLNGSVDIGGYLEVWGTLINNTELESGLDSDYVSSDGEICFLDGSKYAGSGMLRIYDHQGLWTEDDPYAYVELPFELDDPNYEVIRYDIWDVDYLEIRCLLDAPLDPPAEDLYRAPLVKENGTFNYVSQIAEDSDGKAATVPYNFSYDENWFYQDSTAYNHELAQMSMRVAMAAGRTTNKSIKDLFETLEFTNTEYHFTTPTEKDSIGYAIGSKYVCNADGEKMTLIAVAVRGGGYGNEWGGNFEVGTGAEHDGFRIAADKVLTGIKNHIKEIKADENINIWITGFRRAAATSNLAAHTLNLLARDGSIPGLAVDDIFAYCFECPSGVRKDHSSYNPVDKNIFNIVNPSDFVPMVTPEQWDFGRYGITYYLPSGELTWKGYTKHIGKVWAAYADILAEAGVDKDAKKLTTPNMGQADILKNILDILTAIDQDSYYYFLQEIVTAAMADAKPDIGVGEVLGIILGGISVATIPAITTAVINPINILLSSGVLASYGSSIGETHYPELCLAWMEALSGTDDYVDVKNARTRYLKLNCPVDLSVYDSEGNLVAKIVDDTAQEIEDSFISAYVDHNGQKIVILPFDEEFSIEVDATGNGTMSMQIEEYSVAGAQTTKVINYNDVTVSEGDQLTSTMGESLSFDAEYSLYDPNGIQIDASSQISGEIPAYLVQLVAEGEGTVVGGGSFVPGEYAIALAKSSEGAQFLGWYAEDTLISSKMEYRFRVDRDMIMTAKFSDAILGDINADGRINAKDATMILQYSTGILSPEKAFLKEAADVNSDGKINAKDATLILQYSVGLRDSFPKQK